MPTLILADVGTPLMWASFLYLAVGNLLIAMLEAAVLRFWFKAKGGAIFGWMVLANYVSSIAGLFLLVPVSLKVIEWFGGPLPVYHVYRILAILTLLSFVATLAIEFPFYWLALRRQIHGKGKLAIATAVPNIASYLALIGWFWLASAAPSAWGVSLVPQASMPPNPDIRVLYLSADGTKLMEVSLDGSPPKAIKELADACPYGKLGFTKSEPGGRWRLEVQKDYHNERTFVADIGPGYATTRATYPDQDDDWFFPAIADDFQRGKNPKWTVQTGNWAFIGIQAKNNYTGQSRFIHVPRNALARLAGH
jgi:hypothetical protein